MKLYTITTSKNERKKQKLIEQILKHHLHRRAGCGIMWNWCKYPNEVELVSVAYDLTGEPIGAGMTINEYADDRYGNIGVYVKIKFRKHGIGKEIRNRLIRRSKEYIFVVESDEAEFYKGTGINLWVPSTNGFSPY